VQISDGASNTMAVGEKNLCLATLGSGLDLNDDDGYTGGADEDPLAGVARQFAITAELKRHRPALAIVGSGYSDLQEWLPHVAQAVVRSGGADFVGLGRLALSYPEMPADVLAGRPVDRKRLCRTFSDCTTAPRNGLVSGCYPLDPFYKELPEARRLARIKNSSAEEDQGKEASETMKGK